MSDRIILGTRKALLLFEKGANGWQIQREDFLGVPVTYATLDPRHHTLWACLDHGHWGTKLHRSSDDGRTWEEIESPKYPEGAMIREGVPATTKYLWVLEPGGIDQPDRLYIGTVPGGLFVSDDRGKTWNLQQSLWNHPSRPEHWFGGGMDEAGIHSIVVDPRNSQRVQLGISCAGVFETSNDGATWEPKNHGCSAEFLPNPEVEVGHDPHLLVASRSAPDALWQQNHCGIYRSTDGANRWELVSKSENGAAHFGFAIACDANNPQTAWVIPATSDEKRVAIDRALCVCRTTDGGKTWEAFRKGLPQHNCYDFVFRHGLDVSGDLVTFGTSTGAFYVSEDRGETWEMVAEHLPPIYSVRIAH